MEAITDRFTRGCIAGILAGLVSSVFNLTAYYVGFAKLRYLDFAGVMIYGRKPTSALEALFAWLGMYMFMALLGAIFAYLILGMTSKNYLFKGWFYGVIVWFAVYAIVILFKVPELSVFNLPTTFANFIGASLWGLALGYIFDKLDAKAKV